MAGGERAAELTSTSATTSGRIRHVLLDADGVLQVLPGGWVDAVRPSLGERAEAFGSHTWHDDPASLRGENDFLVALAADLTRRGVRTTLADLYPAVRGSIATVPETLALVPRLRRAGYGVHLGTNQERHRAAYMRSALGYDELFDVSCYSCDLGMTKPSASYFTESARRIGADPASILFVDDTAGNVSGARAAGLLAEQWRVDLQAVDRGVPALLDLLAGHGVHPRAG